MPILNYTTTIAVERSLGEIHHILATHGARRVTTSYTADGLPDAVEFGMDTPFGPQEFRLPANADGVWHVLTRQYDAGKVQRRFATREQAARVAWRIVKDWLEAQVAIIEAGMMTMDAVMLPHLIQGPERKTLYQSLVDHQLALPKTTEGVR